ncbi:hypothetical protein Pelo_19747 [Pelomyxa schiedti]|nr:hypothetical protein Pelo_19747 [Pelomyxa schiedti]
MLVEVYRVTDMSRPSHQFERPVDTGILCTDRGMYAVQMAASTSSATAERVSIHDAITGTPLALLTITLTVMCKKIPSFVGFTHCL